MPDQSVIHDLVEKVGKLTGTLEQFLETEVRKQDEQDSRLTAVEKDVAWLKSLAWKVTGGLIVLSALLQVLKSQIIAFFSGDGPRVH